MPTGGDLVVEGLEKAHARYVFGIPAVHNLPVYDALSRSSSMRTISVKHEQAAGFMAIGAAYASGTPAACVVGCGPGATNALTPTGEAYLNSVPMLVIAGGLRTTSTGKGALHDVDQISMFRPITKRSSRLLDVNSLDGQVEAAMLECRRGRPRPIFLEVPFDVLSSEADSTPSDRSAAVQPTASRPEIDEKALSSTISAISAAKRPLVIAGGGVNSAECWVELREFAERNRLPVATTISAKGAFPEGLPLSAGQLWDSVARQAAEHADVVLALGCRFSERSTASWGLRINGTLVQVDIDPAEIGRNYPASIAVNADIKDFLARLDLGVRDECGPERVVWSSRIEQDRKERKAQLGAAPEPRSDALPRPQAVFQRLAGVIPDDAVIVAETGHAFWWAALMLEVKRPRSFLSPAGNSTLGFGLPAALGAKCARGDRPVVCLVGDGGFLFSCQELLTSVEEKLPVVVIVFDDGGYAAIREYQRRGYGSRFIGVDFGARPDLVKLAQSFGADGILVESEDQVAPAVRSACDNAHTTTLVDIKVGRDEDVLPRFFTEIYRQR